MSRKFATMTDDERRRFAQEQGESAAGQGNEEAADEVEIDDPRDGDRTGRQYPSLRAEVAEADARDGEAALLDDQSHERAIERRRARRRAADRPDRGSAP